MANPAGNREARRRPAEASLRLSRSLFPVVDRRTSAGEATALFLFGVVVAFFHVGTGAVRGRVWAEDGMVFLTQAYAVGPIRAISVQYAGYLSVVPRLAAAVVYILPITWQGIGLHVAAAVVQSMIGLVAYVATVGHVGARWVRGLLAVCVVAIPVGPEVIGNISNLQWFVVFGAAISLLWTPSTRWGWVVICLLVIGATTSSPFGFVILALAGIRYMIQRNRATLIVLTATALGFIAQTVAMIHAPERTGLADKFAPAPLVRGYLNRVIGDGVFGVGRFSPVMQASVVAGVVVLCAVAALVAVASVRNLPVNYPVIVVLATLSVLTFLGPAISIAPPFANPFAASRYYVTPALFAEAFLLVLVADTFERPVSIARRSSWIAGAASLLIVGGMGFGLVSSYRIGGDHDRGPSWVQLVQATRQGCAGKPGATMVQIPIQPPGWTMTLRCEQL